MGELSRPEVHRVLMGCALLWAERSTCSRLHVGAVFALDQRILVTGYNGAPAGLPHCDHACTCHLREVQGHWDNEERHFDGCQSLEPCTKAEHAERNGIAFAARHGIKLDGSHLYVTHMPCAPCAMSIINAGVERVYYRQSYRDTSGIALIQRAGIGVVHLIPETEM